MKYGLNYSLTHFLSHYRIVPSKRSKFIISPSGTNLPLRSAGLAFHHDYDTCAIVKIPFTLLKHLLSSETNQSMALRMKRGSTNLTLCGCSTAPGSATSSSQSSIWCLAAAAYAGLGNSECANADLTRENRPGQPN